jgi:hypothetical protein
LRHIREYVQDLVHEEAVKTFPAYNYPVIRRAVEDYYAGASHCVRTVDWWLAFEIWRRRLRM